MKKTIHFSRRLMSILFFVLAIILGAGINTTSSQSGISPCETPLPLPCSSDLDAIHLNYTQHSYGFPAVYKKVVVSERLQPQPFMTTSYDGVPFNPWLLVCNFIFWYLLFDLGQRFLVQNKVAAGERA